MMGECPVIVSELFVQFNTFSIALVCQGIAIQHQTTYLDGRSAAPGRLGFTDYEQGIDRQLANLNGVAPGIVIDLQMNAIIKATGAGGGGDINIRGAALALQQRFDVDGRNSINTAQN